MADQMIIVDGVRYRREEAEARGLLAGRNQGGEPRALSLTAQQVDVDALVEARVKTLEDELNAQHQQRTEELEAAHAARAEELEATHEARVEEAVEAALAAAKDEGGSASEPVQEKAAAKPRNKAATPANK